MIKPILIIGLGGGIGSVLQYLVQLGMSRAFMTSFPAGTMLINITGSFAIGLLYGLAGRFRRLLRNGGCFSLQAFAGGFP